MLTKVSHLEKLLAFVTLWCSAGLPILAADEDFAQIAKRTFSDHAKNYQDGNARACVSMYADDAKIFVDGKLVARGTGDLLEFYRGLREVDTIIKIDFDEFVDVGSKENFGWVVFNYTKVYELKKHPDFVQQHKLEAYTTLKTRQYGTALLAKIEGHWRVQIMTVFDPKKWDPQK